MKIIDLFAGAGGMSRGFENSGFKVVLASEKDEWASETYAFNHKGTRVICGDVKKIKPLDLDLGKIDGVIGGPPCQGFSLSGKRDQKDPRNSLFMEFVRITNDVKPKFFVMENVKGILSMKTAKGIFVKDIIIEQFVNIGFDVKVKVLKASDYGVPQNRERVFFIGVKKELNINPDDLFPIPFKSKPISIKDAIDDLPKIKSGEGSEEFEYPKSPQNDYQKLMRKNSVVINNHQAMKHTQRILDRFKVIREGQSLGDVTGEHMQRQRGNPDVISGKRYSQNNTRPHYNKPSPTITASFQSGFIHPKIDRNFTAREAARIQSFPDDYVFKGDRTTMSWENRLSQYQQIGNAVPPLLAEAISKRIKEMIWKK